MLTIQEMMAQVVQQNGSDLHLVVGTPPVLRVHGKLFAIEGQTALTPADTEQLIQSMLTPEQKELFAANKEHDFSYQFGEYGRFRVNIYYEQGAVGAAFRLIPSKIRTIDDLNLPSIMHDLTKLKQGLVLVTGPTGHGKSTTLAAMIEEINRTRGEHILTIEDPIEFVYTPVKSIISQREVHADTHSWDIALRSALREDPDVVLVGEMRDYETIAAAITIAETGHLVLATLHTNSAAQTVDRMIDVFPASQQAQIRSQLAMSLQAIISQRLLPAQTGGRAIAMEVLIASSAVRNLIREGKTFQIDSVMETGVEAGMITMEMSLAALVNQGVISMETAREYSMRPGNLDKAVKRTV